MEILIEDRLIATRLRSCEGFWIRGVGFMGRRCPNPPRGLVFRRCGSLHTCFMRFRLDVMFLDREDRVVRVFRDVGPWRMVRGGKGARTAVEVPAGELGEVAVGDGVRWRET